MLERSNLNIILTLLFLGALSIILTIVVGVLSWLSSDKFGGDIDYDFLVYNLTE